MPHNCYNLLYALQNTRPVGDRLTPWLTQFQRAVYEDFARLEKQVPELGKLGYHEQACGLLKQWVDAVPELRDDPAIQELLASPGTATATDLASLYLTVPIPRREVRRLYQEMVAVVPDAILLSPAFRELHDVFHSCFPSQRLLDWAYQQQEGYTVLSNFLNQYKKTWNPGEPWQWYLLIVFLGGYADVNARCVAGPA